MDLREATQLGEEQASHWYYRSKFELLKDVVGPSPSSVVLDVGAGTGIFSRQLLETTSCREAICVDLGYEKERTEYVNDRPMRFCRSAAGASPDLVLFMDVLEHVEDDEELLASYVRDMRPGTKFFLTVPAFRWLWSGHDVFLGHHRRYTLPELEKVATRAGLQVLRGGYFLGLLLPLVAATRIGEKIITRQKTPRSQMRSHGRFLNRIMLTLGYLDVKLFARNRAGGVTAYLLASKV